MDSWEQEENDYIIETLRLLIREGFVECGWHEKGDFVFWMTEEQKARASELSPQLRGDLDELLGGPQ
tara:strand:- start:4031 stop:4231 length:201 start_codon:yes stop_codon:yes gene_type:complete